MKKLNLLLLLLFSVISLNIKAHDFEAVNSDGKTIYYNITSSNNLTVSVTYKGKYSHSNSNEYEGVITIPSTVSYYGKTYSVTSIGNDAFSGCYGLTSIEIPNSVTSIGEYAFNGCSGLTSLTIGNSVTSIGGRAFYDCTGLTSVTIPNSVTSIGSNAFNGCSGLTSLTIGNSVTSIGNDAFYNCTGLKELTLEDGEKTLSVSDSNVFHNAPLETLYLGRNLSYSLFKLPTLRSVTIGNSVTSIGERAFYNCTGLTSVTIGNSVTSIGIDAFRGCSGLTSIEIPNSVTEIGGTAFFYCTSLTSVTIGNSVTSIGNDAFSGCYGLTSIEIPNSVTSIGEYAFEDCTRLTSVTIGNSVTSIGKYAFYKCSGLTSVTIPNSVTSIGSNAFRGCNGLTSLTIGNSVTSIGYNAFYGCSGLTSITIPSSVTSIGGSAFYDCTGLTAVYITDLVAWYNINFGDYYANPLYYTKKLYLNESIVRKLEIPEGVTAIKDYAFVNLSTIRSVTIPNSVTSIGHYAFYGCNGLTSVTIGNSVTSIGDYAFYWCMKLTSITIPNSVISIGSNAFYYCRSLDYITIGSGVTSIGSDAFYYCDRLKYVYITDLAAWLNIDFDNANANPLCYSYYGFKLNEKFVIPEDVTVIKNYAFYSCSLSSLTLGSKVSEIGLSAFADTYLEAIYSLAEYPPFIYTSTFKGVDKTIPVYIPKGTKEDYELEWSEFTNFIETDFAGVEDNEITNNEIKVIEGNGIEISDYYGRIRIVNLAGQVVKDVYVDGYIQLSLPKGIYVVVTEDNSQKVIL